MTQLTELQTASEGVRAYSISSDDSTCLVEAVSVKYGMIKQTLAITSHRIILFTKCAKPGCHIT